MRRAVDKGKLCKFIEELGRRVQGPGRVYLTGGATAVLLGWRESTVDIDVKLDPEPKGAFEAIATLKEELEINVELASPADFIPPVPGWEGRRHPITSVGKVEFAHYDLLSQALAKLERGHKKDIADVRAMFERDLIDVETLKEAAEQIESQLMRYPALDLHEFRQKITAGIQEALPRA